MIFGTQQCDKQEPPVQTTEERSGMRGTWHTLSTGALCAAIAKFLLSVAIT